MDMRKITKGDVCSKCPNGKRLSTAKDNKLYTLLSAITNHEIENCVTL